MNPAGPTQKKEVLFNFSVKNPSAKSACHPYLEHVHVQIQYLVFLNLQHSPQWRQDRVKLPGMLLITSYSFMNMAEVGDQFTIHKVAF